MKRIIVEGIDGSGKSTLISELRSEFHFLLPVVNDKQSEQNFNEWWPYQLEVEYQPGIIPIHDRFYYSELVYGPVIRGSLVGDRKVHIDVRNQLRKEAFLIYCRPTLANIIKDSKTNEQMDGVLTNLPELLEGYDKIMQMQPVYYGNRFLVYDWHYRSDFNTLVRQLEGYLVG
jgi:thymidylate kinase